MPRGLARAARTPAATHPVLGMAMGHQRTSVTRPFWRRRAANGEKFAKLWSGDVSGYPSQSEADLALCGILAFWTRDRAQIDRLFRQS
jgi:primase-polymerase (primpol)-like protein